MNLTVLEYEALARILKSNSGLLLGANKEYLLESRLLPLCREMGLESLSQLVSRLEKNPLDKVLIKKVNDLMTTNESLFFRDYTPFEILSQRLLPEILKKRQTQKKLRIWSAACSTGQEPYSIAMMLREMPYDFKNWDIQIVATDYSESVLQKAATGIFSSHEVARGLPTPLLLKHFDDIGEGRYQVKSDLKKGIEWKFLNLLQPWHFPTFDIIFLRNVLIYFEPQMKSQILEKMSQVIVPDGLLLLGGSESIFGLTDKWTSIDGVRSAIFKPKEVSK